MIHNKLLWFDAFFLTYFLLLNFVYFILLILTIPVLSRRIREIDSLDINALLASQVAPPPVSIILAAYNEELVILESVAAALNVKFPRLNVIVVNDGSTDATLSKLINAYKLVEVPPAIPSLLKTAPVLRHFRSELNPNLLVIDKENGGREDANNAGINACTTPYFVGTDADSFIESDTLHRLMQHLLTVKDICAMGGSLRIANGCIIEKGVVKQAQLPKSFYGKMQVLEYMRIFLYGRLGWNMLGGSYLISGGFGIYKKDSVISVGGYKKVLAGDLDLTMRIHEKMRETNKPYVIDHIHDAVVWTDVPQTYDSLAKQRIRWHSSIIDVCWRFRHMICNIRYGRIGFLHIPYLLLGEGLGPVVEGLGYLYIIYCFAFDLLNRTFFLYFIMIAWGYSLLLTVCSLIMQQASLRSYFSDQAVIKLFLLSLLENLGYRQLTVYWRIKGIFRYFSKKRFAREKMERDSFNK